jgi:hypothetical protein
MLQAMIDYYVKALLLGFVVSLTSESHIIAPVTPKLPKINAIDW